ncbi:MAG: hypothetical protein ABJH04_15605 [Cyclobacteriaceae bacterium]
MTHVKNVETFEKLLGFCSGYGDKYNPGLPKLQLDALSVLLVNARQALASVKANKTEYNFMTNDREELFRNMPRLAASVILTLAASGAKEETLDDARVFFRLMTGRRAKARIPLASTEEEKEKRSKFAQLSYISKADHFARLVQTISVAPNYTANEPELSVAGLKSILKKMNSLNSGVAKVEVALSNARISRNELLYTSDTAIYNTAASVKKYVRAIFGLNSEQYRQIKSLRFTKPKI